MAAATGRGRAGEPDEMADRAAQNPAPGPVGRSAGGIGDPDPRSLQRRVAAATASTNFTKYPKWYDEDACIWKPASKHRAYDPCRKLLDRVRGLTDRVAREFDDQTALDWLTTTIPNAWRGEFGVYNFVRFVDLYLPRRGPDLLHGLYGIEIFDRIQLHWAYKAPGWKRRHADPTTFIRHARTSWDGGDLPPCCYPSEPEPHEWSEPGFLLPEGSPLRYVRRLPWWIA